MLIRGHRNRLYQFIMQLMHRIPPEPCPRLREPGPAGDFDLRRRPQQPMQALQQATQHLTAGRLPAPHGRLHVESQRDHEIDRDVRWKIALPDAGSTR